jgi:hypothetical protein
MGKEVKHIVSADAENLEKVFKDLQFKEQRSIMISAFRKATKQTVARTKSNIYHNVTRNLYRSIGVLTVRNEAAIIVGARKRGAFKGWHGHLVEDGTKERSYRTKLGNIHRTGRMSASGAYAGYFRKAIASTENAVLKIMGDEWYAAIDKFHKKHRIR